VPNSFQVPPNILPHGGGAITVAGNLAPGGNMFDLQNTTAFPIKINSLEVRFGSFIFGAVPSPTPVSIYRTTTATTWNGNQLNAGAWTPVELNIPVTVAGPNSEFSLVPLTADFTLMPGEQRGIFVRGVNNSIVYDGAGSSTLNPFTNGQLRLVSGVGIGGLFAGPGPFGPPRTPNIRFNYQIGATPQLMLTKGKPSGSGFPIGTTENCFTVNDAAGNPGSCCFNVIVKEFPNPTNVLTCNQSVQVSLDENCEALLNADDILEGGPYKCYDNYTVMVLNATGGPLNNPANKVTGANLGGPWTVKVTDPATGQSCWGKIIVEDKIAPEIFCADRTIACTETAPNVPNPPFTGSVEEIVYSGLNDTYGPDVPNTLTYNFDFSYIPAGAQVLDVDARVDNTHPNQRDTKVTVQSPDGTNIDIFNVTGCFGQAFPMDVWFDDEGTGGLTSCFQLDQNGGHIQCFVNPGVQNNTVLAGFDGKANGNGQWKVIFTDELNANGAGTVFQVGLHIVFGPAPALPDPSDNCGPVTLTFVDANISGNCAGPSGTLKRTWTAKDPSGNKTSCTQTITYARPSLADVDVPADIKWTCEQYAAFPNITSATPLHPFIQDSDPSTLIIDVNLDQDCDDEDFSSQDNPAVNSTNVANGGQGCPGRNFPNNGLDDADVLALTGSGVPTVNGLPLKDLCGISVESVDLPVPVCDGSFKIIRKWTIIDWCANPVGVKEMNQVIKVTDEVPPMIKAVEYDTFHVVYTIGQIATIKGQNVTVSIGPNPPATFHIGDTIAQTATSWTVIDDIIIVPPSVKLKVTQYDIDNQIDVDVYSASVPQGGGPHASCEGTVVIPPAVDMGDNCSQVASWVTELSTLGGTLLGTVNTNGGVFFNIPLFQNGNPAQYRVTYRAKDACGNQANLEVTATLRDRVPPVAVCDEITEVSITNNGVNTGESCSTLYAEDLDDGSYDNCKPVYFLAAKMSASISQDIFNRCYYPSLKFCCNEIGNQTVIVLVLDGDPTPFFNPPMFSPSFGCDGTPGLFLGTSFNALNFNTCMVTVQVTDKLPPVRINCPDNKRITCDWYAQNLETQLMALQGNATAQCNFLNQFFGQPTYYDNCAVNLTCQYQNNVDQCLEGTITRTWNATDNATPPNQAPQPCTQRIFVDHISDWVVEFPQDITVFCQNDTVNVPGFGEPKIFFETCELVAISKDDKTFTVVPDACFKVIRTWTVINWCVVGANVDQEVVEASESQFGFPLANCDFDGDNDCDTRTFRDSWNRLTGNHPVTGQPYKQRPGASDAASFLPIYNPDTDPDSDPWDGYITYEQVIKVQDLSKPQFTNGCPVQDFEVGANCLGTISLTFPPVKDCVEDQYIKKNAQVQIGGVWVNAVVNGVTQPILNVSPGTYNVRYIAEDMCNNQSQCNSTVRVLDKKKPTPYCEFGLVIELMNTTPPMVQVWASDFDKGSFDNCPGALKFSFSANTSYTGRTFDCDSVDIQIPIRMWVTDAAGNQDYCETFIIVQDNMTQCPDTLNAIALSGTTATEANAGVQGVSVNVNSPSGFNNTLTTTANGQYNANVPAGNDYSITPILDKEPLNGVTTFDLVLISKHILGVQALDSPYKIIAADANKSNSVTTFDLVEIRKLILFINTDYPNNTSWRFVDKKWNFQNPSNPFVPQFPEVINFNNLTANQLSADFVAVKVGDVNGNAAVNLLGSSSEERNMVGDLVFDVEDADVKEGEYYTVNFKATDFNVSGYQFTLNFDKNALEFAEVAPGLAEAGNFGLTLLDKGVITTSWNSDEAKQLASGETVFGLTFKAKQSGRLSDLLSLGSRYTVAEAYTADAQLLNVALSFNNQVVKGGFDLYQNTPNPFASTTVVGFYLPEATSATLTISDVQGKVVKVINGDYAKGYNQVTLKRSELGASGVLYYRLDTATDTATRKMILVD
jgi:hypothetical protein